MTIGIYYIRCEQLVADLSDVDDRQYLPAGPGGMGSIWVYDTSAESIEDALDKFHREVPIGCLEEFSVRALPQSQAGAEGW